MAEGEGPPSLSQEEGEGERAASHHLSPYYNIGIPSLPVYLLQEGNEWFSIEEEGNGGNNIVSVRKKKKSSILVGYRKSII